MAREKTLGIKTTDEKYNQWLEVFKSSGFSNYEEWMESLIAAKDLDIVQENNKEYTQDITELKVHTTRINELVSNMVKRAIYIKDDAVRELETKLDSKDLIVQGLQNEVKSLKESLENANAAVETLTTKIETIHEDHLKVVEDLNEKIQGAKEEAEGKQTLINQLTENNEIIKKENVNLSSLVAEFKDYKDENVKIKEEFRVKEEKLLDQIQEFKQSFLDERERIEKLKNENNQLIDSHKANIDRLTNEKDMEKREEILALKQAHQEELAQIRDAFNNKIAELYERLDHQRETKDTGREGKIDNGKE